MRRESEERVHFCEVTTEELGDIYKHPDWVGTPNQKYVDEGTTKFRKSSDYGWYGRGVKSQEQIDSIMHGWKKGAEKLTALKSEVIHGLGAKTRRRCLTWADHGDDLNTDKAMRGDWDTAWRRSVRRWAAGLSHVDLVCKWGFPHYREEEEAFWQGATMLVIADCLEEAGYSVKLTASMPLYDGHYDDNFYIFNVNVKDYDQPLRVDSLAGFCHPGVFRTYGFQAICTAPWNVSDGIACHAPIERYNRESRFKTFANSVLFKREYQDTDKIIVDDCYSKDAALNMIHSVLQKIDNPQ